MVAGHAVMVSFHDNSAFWGLNSSEEIFVTGDTLGRLEPAAWLLLCLGTLSVSCVLCSAWDAANFQGMLSNCLPSRSLLIPAASRRVLAIDSDANGQITRQKSLLEGSESTSGPEASTLYCVNYSLF